ncbi:aromatic hydrocarbon degradation protein [Ginsengibacter hankyongi]|uniref:Aromatic hydrocarbon degradation protein n=1 Tax=Ginsengibacter hankyongi TaxID=2607284 RepID=A0A5J5ILQ9_9BACT|nr:aromatic hydrocarbon degradation protein [Ginsengibacter hankyongi]KAA9041303.1 aromatic hydrocarbon degradation protein [Ginsengibacter hankyongi]
MKAMYLIAIVLFAVTKSYAQEPADALRYSWLTTNGTARNQAIGGAGASLGGEFSSLFINPAGLGFYKTNEFVLTPGYSLKNFNSTYKANSEKSNNNNFNLGASGLLISSPTPDRPIKSFTFAIGANRIADFNKNIYYKGQNSTSSYSEKYLEELANNNVTDPNSAAADYPFGSSQAFNTYLIDTVHASDGSVSGYRSQANPNFGLIQENTINTSGGITDISAGVGLDLNEKFFFGGTLSFPFLNYDRNSHYKESDASGNANNNFNYFESNETLNTKGIGINGKLGIIYKPMEDVRIGVAVHTPTIYQLTDKYSAEVITDLEGYGGAGVKSQSTLDLNNGQLLETKYNLVAPLKVIVSGSYVFREAADVRNQRGFITADVEYANYKGASFKAADKTDATSKNYYSSLTDAIKNTYKNAINARIGGELKYNTYMFRLGGAYYGNPYKNETASLYKVSGGLGYRNKGIFIDLTYVYTINKDINYPYLLQDKPNVPALIKNTGGNIIATIGFKI